MTRYLTEDEAMTEFESFVDEHFPTVTIMSYDYNPARTLKRIDPTAFYQEFLNYCDSEEIDTDGEAPEEEDEAECDGHESLAGEHMGETVYCDGECKQGKECDGWHSEEMCPIDDGSCLNFTGNRSVSK